jgi:hypothetical protein
VRGYSTGVKQIAQGIVLAVGLTILGLIRGGRITRLLPQRR